MSLRFIRFILTLLLLCKNPYAADCPLLGQAFPPPRMLSRSSTWKKAIEDFESNLKALLSQSTDLDAMTTSFSINIFSSHEKNLLYEYHHDAPGLKGSIAKGQKLNGDTMYRIASISKAMTLYTFLIETGFKYFNEPVAKFVPEIEREIQRQGVNLDDTLVPQWREITVGSLASQLSGIGRGKLPIIFFANCKLSINTPLDYYNDMAGRVNQTVSTQFGLPALRDSEIPRCGQRGPHFDPCTRRGKH